MKTLKESILSHSSHSSETAKNIILIEEWLKRYNIKNYTIKDNFEIDVDGYVNLYMRNITELPSYIQFGIVKGYFLCEECGLISLRGCPKKVEEYFNCSNNKLTSLEGGPVEVGEYFDCSNNKLTTLKGGPVKVGGDLYCSYNKLTTLKGSPVEVGGNFYCRNNKLTSLKGGPIEVGGSFYCRNNSIEITVDNVIIK